VLPPAAGEKVGKLAREADKLGVLPWLADPVSFATDDRLSPMARLVLALLARHANHSGECFPGVRRLAQQAGCRPQRISDATRELERAGRIRVHRSRRGNRYMLLTDIPQGGGLLMSGRGKHREAV
jgi:DNA-binding MarR family transcriptional regulator